MGRGSELNSQPELICKVNLIQYNGRELGLVTVQTHRILIVSVHYVISVSYNRYKIKISGCHSYFIVKTTKYAFTDLGLYMVLRCLVLSIINIICTYGCITELKNILLFIKLF